MSVEKKTKFCSALPLERHGAAGDTMRPLGCTAHGDPTTKLAMATAGAEDDDTNLAVGVDLIGP
jgi:hypothetical protein